MSRAVFIAVDAYDWDVSIEHQATFSLLSGGQKIVIDSTKRPRGGQSVEDAIIDDEAGGATSVNSTENSGSLYVEREYAKRTGLPLLPKGYRCEDSDICYGDRKYEFMTIQYSRTDSKYSNRRYYGFHAIWTAGAAHEAILVVFHAGTSKLGKAGEVIRRTIDLEDPAVVLPQIDMPTGTRPARLGESGAIFLRCKVAQNADLLLPKLPQALEGRLLKCPAQD
jgi:hypothetical protein